MYGAAMEPITITTTLTGTRPLALLVLSSGNAAALDLSVSVGDVVIWVLLATLVALQVLQILRTMPWKAQ